MFDQHFQSLVFLVPECFIFDVIFNFISWILQQLLCVLLLYYNLWDVSVYSNGLVLIMPEETLTVIAQDRVSVCWCFMHVIGSVCVFGSACLFGYFLSISLSPPTTKSCHTEEACTYFTNRNLLLLIFSLGWLVLCPVWSHHKCARTQTTPCSCSTSAWFHVHNDCSTGTSGHIQLCWSSTV